MIFCPKRFHPYILSDQKYIKFLHKKQGVYYCLVEFYSKRISLLIVIILNNLITKKFDFPSHKMD